LQPEHAAIIAMQHPDVVKTKVAGGCPAADYEERAPGLAAFQVRNLCVKDGEALVGSYLVDLDTGQMWDDPDQQHAVDSPSVRSTRNQVCSMSVRGVVPSLLPQAHASRSAVRRIGTAKGKRRAGNKRGG
jgi:hypothetical protein